jgi:hypothetical protein
MLTDCVAFGLHRGCNASAPASRRYFRRHACIMPASQVCEGLSSIRPATADSGEGHCQMAIMATWHCDQRRRRLRNGPQFPVHSAPRPYGRKCCRASIGIHLPSLFGELRQEYATTLLRSVKHFVISTFSITDFLYTARGRNPFPDSSSHEQVQPSIAAPNHTLDRKSRLLRCSIAHFPVER